MQMEHYKLTIIIIIIINITLQYIHGILMNDIINNLMKKKIELKLNIIMFYLISFID